MTDSSRATNHHYAASCGELTPKSLKVRVARMDFALTLSREREREIGDVGSKIYFGSS
jgi:hypothetical protein